MNNIRLDLMVIDPDAPEADVYEGYHAVCKAWEEYYKTCDTILSSEDEDRFEWTYHNHYAILINPITRNVYGIRDYGRYSLDAEDNLFRTPYIPMRTDQPETSQELAEHVDRLISLYQKEISLMYRMSSKPLFLIEYADGGSNFRAWSLAEHKPLYVYGYEGYHDYFFIADNEYSDIEENVGYTILPPSHDLAKELGLRFALGTSNF